MDTDEDEERHVRGPPTSTATRTCYQRKARLLTASVINQADSADWMGEAIPLQHVCVTHGRRRITPKLSVGISAQA